LLFIAEQLCFPISASCCKIWGENAAQLIKKQLMAVPQGQFASWSLKRAGYYHMHHFFDTGGQLQNLTTLLLVLKQNLIS